MDEKAADDWAPGEGTHPVNMTDGRDDIEAIPPELVPVWRIFPIDRYTAILRAGQAAATKKRYDSREVALREATAVEHAIRYYATHHPELAPAEWGLRTWQSREDGRWRWAIIPVARPRRTGEGHGKPRVGRLGSPR